MSLNDREEKLRQAREWLDAPDASLEQAQAAAEYLLYRMREQREELPWRRALS
jgi:hypothetical protein